MKRLMKLMLVFVLTLMYLIPNISAVINNKEEGLKNNGVIEINNAVVGKKIFSLSNIKT